MVARVSLISIMNKLYQMMSVTSQISREVITILLPVNWFRFPTKSLVTLIGSKKKIREQEIAMPWDHINDLYDLD